MRQKGIFITGTDTGVGKTYIGVRLAKALTESGIQVAARKPVESGCTVDNGKLIPEDAQALFIASGQNGSLAQCCPYRFSQPVSPERAARLEGVELSLLMLATACRNGVRNKDFLIVEGAGGFYSPLSHDGLNADLASKLALPILLVAENRLGCINHVLLSAEAIHRKGLELLAVIVNDSGQLLDSAMDNAEDLKQLLSCPIIRVGHNTDESDAALQPLIRLFSGHID